MLGFGLSFLAWSTGALVNSSFITHHSSFVYPPPPFFLFFSSPPYHRLTKAGALMFFSCQKSAPLLQFSYGGKNLKISSCGFCVKIGDKRIFAETKPVAGITLFLVFAFRGKRVPSLSYSVRDSSILITCYKSI